MHYKVEKWLTIAALTGWIGSMVSLVGLAVQSAPLAAVRSAQHQPQSVSQLGSTLSPAASLENEIAQAQIPQGISHDFWLKSLRSPNQSSQIHSTAIANR